MTTGDYILKSERKIPIFKLDGLDMSRLIHTAEYEWSTAPQARRDPGEMVDLTIRI